MFTFGQRVCSPHANNIPHGVWGRDFKKGAGVSQVGGGNFEYVITNSSQQMAVILPFI